MSDPIDWSSLVNIKVSTKGIKTLSLDPNSFAMPNQDGMYLSGMKTAAAYESTRQEKERSIVNRQSVYEVTIGHAVSKEFEFTQVVANSPENARVKAFLELGGTSLQDIDIDDLDFNITPVLTLRDVKE